MSHRPLRGAAAGAGAVRLRHRDAGPLFFGAAQKALSEIAREERRGVSVVVLDLSAVPALDATGLVNRQSLVRRLNDSAIKVILAGVPPQPMRVFAGAGWRNRHGRLRIFRSFDRAIALARRTRTVGVEGRHR